MNLSNSDFRFSGHDTFHCKEQWLLKGVQLSNNQGFDCLRSLDAIPALGVGKNMVRSIQHWLKSFGLVDENGNISEFSNLLFLEEGLDPYLENEGSLWLLQYYLCKGKYATIFNLIFADYFSDKATFEFSEYQIFKFINNQIRINELKPIAIKTFETDFKVFIRTYYSNAKSDKTVEDDFNVPLVPLNLIENTGRVNDKQQNIFRINTNNNNIPIEIIAYCLLDQFPNEVVVNFDMVRKTLGAYLCLSNDWLDHLLNELSLNFREFTYKKDAGVRQVQIKIGNRNNFKTQLLVRYYGE